MAQATDVQKATANRRTKQKYPQMYNADGTMKDKYKEKKPSWLDRLRKSVARQTKKNKSKDTARTSQVTGALKNAGLTDAEINRMRGR